MATLLVDLPPHAGNLPMGYLQFIQSLGHNHRMGYCYDVGIGCG